MANEKKLAHSIIDNVGGMENIDNIINCMTRIRIKVHDESKVEFDNLKAIDGVMGVVHDDRIQVIVGQEP